MSEPSILLREESLEIPENSIKIAEKEKETRLSKIELFERYKGIIKRYLTINKGKAFTANTILNRCLELEKDNVEINKVERCLRSLQKQGVINSEIKDMEYFYFVPQI